MKNVVEMIQSQEQRSILAILQDERFYPVGDLAYMAGMSVKDTRGHIAELVGENIINTENNGRHSYYGIEDTATAARVAEVLNSMPKPDIRPLKQDAKKSAVGDARTCYSHIAGELGVRLAESLMEHGYIVKGEQEFNVTEKGESFFCDLGIVLPKKKGSRKCLDWTERRHHIAGSLGRTLLERFLEWGWIERVSESRSLKVTNEGEKQLKRNFAIDI
ncbi:winged helix-turn-helix domain-containing protein [Virgibacillus siamensis]|uniref:Winged helix-turn-helix domain-containing protein n=1 Tax=Virgibacillus siamensis TaxID=480071 RepID=A0ABN1G597_9BACI